MAPAAAEEALDLDRCLSAALEVATAAGDIIAEVLTLPAALAAGLLCCAPWPVEGAGEASGWASGRRV